MDKKSLSEAEIRRQFIDPALERAGWYFESQVLEEHTFTAGRIDVRGQIATRRKPKRVDYLLEYRPRVPLLVLEAKDNSHSTGSGMQQALTYAEMLDVPFAASSNGDGFLLHDFTGTFSSVETELPLDGFPSPEELWDRYKHWRGIDSSQEPAILQPYYEDPRKHPRYYQRVAVNRTIEAIVSGQDRILLVMATGTGKTLTGFQIIWRLKKAGIADRVLYLADRNVLIDQPYQNDFQPFGDALTQIRHRDANPAFEVFLALYQGVSGSEESKNIYKQFSPGFFDVVVVDECHRGSARADSEWREILEYFEDAVQIGLTATPKETTQVSNIDYFGPPIYTYSLKQGIEDGFLAPYKVIRIDLDKDVFGWRPSRGERDDEDREIPDRIYNQRDFDKTLILDKRTQRVAERVSELLDATNPYGRTIVFCEDVAHADRMRQALANVAAHRVAENWKYVVRITGDAYEKDENLDAFRDPSETYPVIATTSELLTTGVDVQDCELIVLDQRIESMTKFKQIIGRGTRIHEESGKKFFTILDFRKATERFADPDFDGKPVQVYTPGPDEPTLPTGADDLKPSDPPGPGWAGEPYRLRNLPVHQVAERTQYLDPEGRLITESLRDYTRDVVHRHYATLNDFLRHWSEAERKQAIVDELEEQGILFDALAEEVDRPGIDPFDLICHIAFDQPPLTRQERARRVRKRDVFTKYGDEARKVLDALLDKYADQGLAPVEEMDTLRVRPFPELGTPMEILQRFGGREGYLDAVRELEAELYRSNGAA